MRSPKIRLFLLLTLLGAGFAPPAGASTRRALEAAREAAELNDEERSDCRRKMASKLEDLIDALKDAREDGSSRAAERKAKAAMELAEDACPRRLARQLGKKLEAVLDELESSGRDDDRGRDRDRGRRRDRGRDREREEPVKAEGMEQEAYDGFVASLRANQNELTKLDMVKNVLSAQQITAKQLGPVLAQFNNELLKLDAAKAAAPKLTNPGAALGWATQFRNSLLAADYTNLISQQRR